jgi:PKD repeat protein
MKNILGALILGALLLISINAISATSNLELMDVDLNGQNQVTVNPGESINVSLIVNTHGDFWKSTRYIVGDQIRECVDTPNYSSGIPSESFIINAPLEYGTYDFTIVLYGEESCNNYEDEGILYEGVIVVDEVECVLCEINLESPDQDQYYGDNIFIDWTATGADCPSSWNVYYGEWDAEEGCDLSSDEWGLGWLGNPHVSEFSWDVNQFDEGRFCVKVEGDCCRDDIVGPFYVDNLPPIVNLTGLNIEGDYICSEGSSILLNGEDSVDPGQFPSGIASYEWYVDGNLVGERETFEYLCLDGPDTLTVELVVTDNAGNGGSDETQIEVLNVDPVCTEISGPLDIAIGFEAIFNGIASDVNADLPLIFNWDFGNGIFAEDINPAANIYDAVGEYTVTLTVEDKDSGSDTCTSEIDVVEPIEICDQEVAAYYNLEADFCEDAGEVENSFDTNVATTGNVVCEKIAGPENLVVYGVGDNCVVEWGDDGNGERPTNDERSSNHILVRVSSIDDGYEYYSFDVVVYTWIIHLEDGWNLISIPYIPEESNSIEDVILNQLADFLPSEKYVAWSYQYQDGQSKWLKSQSHSDENNTAGDLETIMPGYGYWIRIEGSGEEGVDLRGFGTQLAQDGEFPGLPPEVEVPTNSWTLIGRYGIIGQNSCPFLKAGTLEKAVALDSLNKLDNDLNLYQIDELGHLDITNILLNNEGYWLWIEDNFEGNANTETYAPLDPFYTENRVDICEAP